MKSRFRIKLIKWTKYTVKDMFVNAEKKKIYIYIYILRQQQELQRNTKLHISMYSFIFS